MKTYFHFRLYRDGNVMACGGVTVRASVETFPRGTQVTFAHAVCSWKDNYSKAIGRAITDGRADRGLAQPYANMFIEPPSHLKVLRLAQQYAEAQAKRLTKVADAMLVLPFRAKGRRVVLAQGRDPLDVDYVRQLITKETQS